MSFACPISTDPKCEGDTVVNILRRVFGEDYINAFLIDGMNPALQSSSGVMSMASSTVSSLAITAATLIIVVSAYKWVTESANDGEAVGLTERSGLFGFFGRPLFSLIMLAPTASKYPLIHIIIMMIVLWSNGAANELYGKFVKDKATPYSNNSALLDNPALQQANSVHRAVAYGSIHGYCAKTFNQVMNAGMELKHSRKSYNYNDQIITSENSGFIYSAPSTSILKSDDIVRTDDAFTWNATNAIPSTTNLCGSFTAKALKAPYFYKDMLDLTNLNRGEKDVYQALKDVQVDNATTAYKINEIRRNFALRAYLEGLINGYGSWIQNPDPSLAPVSIAPLVTGNTDFNAMRAVEKYNIPRTYNIVSDFNYNGWQVTTTGDEANSATPTTGEVIPNSDNIAIIGNDLSKALNELVKQEIEKANSTSRQQKAESLQTKLLTQGWVTAGHTQAILRRYVGSNSSGLFTKAYDVSSEIGLSPEDIQADENADMVQSIVHSASTTVLASMKDNPLAVQGTSDLDFEAAIAAALDNNNDIDLDGLTTDIGTKSMSPLLGFNKFIIDTMIGTRSSDDALTDIQNVGENLVMTTSVINASLWLAESYLYAAELAVLSGKSVPIIGRVVDLASPKAQEVPKTIRLGFKDMIASPLSVILDHLQAIGRLFAVIIPSMPYLFLILAAVGWFIQIIQTMFGMPLWLVMHAIPEKSFIGSQQQGYVTLLALFFRPILIISAFFLTFVIYDPLVHMFTEAFFQMQNNIAGGSTENSFTETLAYITTLRYWWFVYGAGLVMLTYFLFGLVQELGDTVLNWLGTNLLSTFGNLNTDSVLKEASGKMASDDKTWKESRAAQAKIREGRLKQARDDAEKNEGQDGADGSQNSAIETANDNDNRQSVSAGVVPAASAAEADSFNRGNSIDRTPDTNANNLLDNPDNRQTDGNDTSSNTTRSNIQSESETPEIDDNESALARSSDADNNESDDSSYNPDTDSSKDGVDADSDSDANDELKGNAGSKAFVSAVPHGAVKDKSGNSSNATFKQDAKAKVTPVTDGSGKVVGKSVQNPDGSTMTETKNADGSKTRSVTQPDGSTSVTTVGKDGSVSQTETNAVTGTTRDFNSDSKGNFKEQVKDADGNVLSSVNRAQNADGSYTETAKTDNATSITKGDSQGNFTQSTYANDTDGNATSALLATTNQKKLDDGSIVKSTTAQHADGSKTSTITNTKPNKDYNSTSTKTGANGKSSVIGSSSRVTDSEGNITKKTEDKIAGTKSSTTISPDGSRVSSITSATGKTVQSQDANGNITGHQHDAQGNIVATMQGNVSSDGAQNITTSNHNDNTIAKSSIKADGSSRTVVSDANTGSVLSEASITPTANGAQINTNDHESGVSTSVNMDSNGNYTMNQSSNDIDTVASGNTHTGVYTAESVNKHNPSNNAQYTFKPNSDGTGTLTISGSKESVELTGSKVNGFAANPMNSSAVGAKALGAVAAATATKEGVKAVTESLSQSSAKTSTSEGFDAPKAVTKLSPEGSMTVGSQQYADNTRNGAQPKTAEGVANKVLSTNLFDSNSGQGGGQNITQGGGQNITQGGGQGGGQNITQGGGQNAGQGGGQNITQGGGQNAGQGGGQNITQGGGQGGGQNITQGGGQNITQGGGQNAGQGGGQNITQGGGQGGGQNITQGGGQNITQGGGQGFNQNNVQHTPAQPAQVVGQGDGQGTVKQSPANTHHPSALQAFTAFHSISADDGTPTPSMNSGMAKGKTNNNNNAQAKTGTDSSYNASVSGAQNLVDSGMLGDNAQVKHTHQGGNGAFTHVQANKSGVSYQTTNSHVGGAGAGSGFVNTNTNPFVTIKRSSGKGSTQAKVVVPDQYTMSTDTGRFQVNKGIIANGGFIQRTVLSSGIEEAIEPKQKKASVSNISSGAKEINISSPSVAGFSKAHPSTTYSSYANYHGGGSQPYSAGFDAPSYTASGGFEQQAHSAQASQTNENLSSGSFVDNANSNVHTTQTASYQPTTPSQPRGFDRHIPQDKVTNLAMIDLPNLSTTSEIDVNTPTNSDNSGESNSDE